MERSMRRDEKGFTLVELMVVLLIIGILVAVAIPIFRSTQANAARKANAADLRVLNGAVQMWRIDNPNGTEPTTVDGWEAALAGADGYVETWPVLQKVGEATSTLKWDTTSKLFTCDPADNAKV